MVDATPTLWDTPGRQVLGWQFIEFRAFTARLAAYIESDEAYSRLQQDLAKAPESGEVIPGCSGLRKLRWSDRRRGKGKRGGLRIIYLLVPEVRTIVLVHLYDKDEKDDMSPAEKRLAGQLAIETKEALVAVRQRVRREVEQ